MRKNLIVVVAVTFVLVAALVSAQTPPGSSPDSQIAAAGAKIGAGDFPGATVILEKVVAADPGNKLGVAPARLRVPEAEEDPGVARGL